MPANELTTYDSWDLKPSKVPPHTRLYHLEPVGIGTPYVESLISYITRLAETHSVSTRAVMRKLILPLMNASLGRRWDYNRAGLQNLAGIRALDLVQALETLTLCRNLHSLTMLTWVKVIPTVGLIRSFRAWCPACYGEWYARGQTIYEPLLWSLSIVTACPQHHQYLRDWCPHCGQRFFPLTGRARAGYCAKCSRWLGVLPDTELPYRMEIPLAPEASLESYTWLQDSLGELVAATPLLPDPVLTTRIATILCRCLNQLTQGNVSALARLLRVTRQSVQDWCSGKRLPQLSKLLQICYYLGTSALDFLTAEPVVVTPIPEHVYA